MSLVCTAASIVVGWMAAGLLIALVLGEILREIQKERKRLKAKIPGGEAQW